MESISATQPSIRISQREAGRRGAVRDQLTQRATQALEAGDRGEARRLLEEALRADPRSERSWLWLADLMDLEEERRYCLSQVLSINRYNALARRGLAALGPGPARSPLLQRAVAVLEAGNRAEARRLLEGVVQADPCSERGWLWLAEAVDSDEEQRFCLSQVLSINRRNGLARRRLQALGPGRAYSPLEGRVGPSGVRARQPYSPSRTIRKHEASAGHPALIALAYLAALSLAEVLTALVEPRVGLLLHGSLLVILLLHTGLTWERPGYRLLLSLAFAPLIRLLSLSLPLASFPLIYWYFIVSVPLFAATAVALRVLGFSRMGTGLNLRALPIQIVVALTGLSLGYLEYRILRPAPLVQSFVWDEIWLPGLILLVCTGFAEELIFRGMMQQAATETLGTGWGILYVATLFAVLHLGYQSLADVLFVFGVALFFGLAKAFTGSILGVSLAHGMTNILLFLTIPLGVNYFDIIAYHLYGR